MNIIRYLLIAAMVVAWGTPAFGQYCVDVEKTVNNELCTDPMTWTITVENCSGLIIDTDVGPVIVAESVYDDIHEGNITDAFDWVLEPGDTQTFEYDYYIPPWSMPGDTIINTVEVVYCDFYDEDCTETITDEDSASCVVPPCDSNDDCYSYLCDTATGECVECLVGTDCPGYPLETCISNQCVWNAEECFNDDDCNDDEYCNIAGECTLGECDSNDDCYSGLCDLAIGDCVECLADSDCPFGTCENGVCTPGVCDSNDDCPFGTCNYSGECIDGECAGDAECPFGTCNDSGVCVDGECAGDAECPDGTCNDSGICVPGECTSDAECPFGTCNDSGECVAGECASDADCPFGTCNDSGVCVPGECDSDDDCPDGTCNDSGVCVPDERPLAECETDDDCDRGTCINNVCVVEGKVSIEKCKVKAGKHGKGDKIKFSGYLDATIVDFAEAMGGMVVVTIEAPDIPDMDATTFSFPIEFASLKKGQYKSPKVYSNSVASLKINTDKGKMKLSVKNADLTGLSCPMTLTFQIGIYAAKIELDETIVNGSKPIPKELMEGI